MANHNITTYNDDYDNVTNNVLFTKSQFAKMGIRFDVSAGKHSFTNRIINQWNALRAEITISSSLSFSTGYTYRKIIISTAGKKTVKSPIGHNGQNKYLFTPKCCREVIFSGNSGRKLSSAIM